MKYVAMYQLRVLAVTQDVDAEEALRTLRRISREEVPDRPFSDITVVPLWWAERFFPGAVAAFAEVTQ